MDADTGLRCRLPVHAGKHRHERGGFTRTAMPDAVPERVAELVERATARDSSGLDLSMMRGDADMRSPRQRKWEKEKWRKAKARKGDGR